VYQPLERKQAVDSERAEQLDMLLSHSSDEARKYRKLRDELARMTSDIAEVETQLATQLQDSSWVESLSEMATSHDLEVTDYRIGITQTQPTHDETTVEFRCLGSYASICKFLEKAEQLAKTTKLAKLSLCPALNFDRYPLHLTFVLYSDGNSHDTKEKRGVL